MLDNKYINAAECAGRRQEGGAEDRSALSVSGPKRGAVLIDLIKDTCSTNPRRAPAQREFRDIPR